MSSIVPPSGASTSTPHTDTRRGLFGSKTVPSTQPLDGFGLQLDRHEAGESGATAVLRDSTMSMPRAAGGGAGVHDRDAARENRAEHAGRPRSAASTSTPRLSRARRSSGQPSRLDRAVPICAARLPS
jgi:hypothetical protein